MKTFKFLALCLVGVFGLYSCSNDDKDEKKEEQNKVYLVKSIKLTWGDGSQSQTNFSYENGKLVKVTDIYSNGETSWYSLSYPSTTTINYMDSDGDDGVITLDASENVISKAELTWFDEEDGYWVNAKASFSFWDGNLTTFKPEEDDVYTYSWSEGNLTTSKNVYYDDERYKHEETTLITYSDVKNNTNIDFYLWFEAEDALLTYQFIKSVSKNVPSSIKDDYCVSTITTTLDEKGRPSKMVYDGHTYTFEYYE